MSDTGETRRLVYTAKATNRFQSFKYEQFVFGYDRRLRPVPVEVPEEIAVILLAMKESGCRCHGSKEKKFLFAEVSS